MFSQENQSSPTIPPSEPLQQMTHKKSRRKLYAAIAAVALVIILVASSFIFLPSASATMNLSLRYIVHERMVYQTTNIITNQNVNASLPTLPGDTSTQSYNSTTTMEVTALNGEVYTINESIATQPNLLNLNLPTLQLNISKNSFYNNFMAPGGPLIFYNNTDPATLAYLAQSTVKVGDAWTIPVNTGNASLGLTGQVTITFASLQDTTVPAGTYKTMRIQVQSSILTVHSDNSSILKLPEGMTIQFSGTTYIEESTCRLIKADLTQTTTLNTAGVDRTATMYTEKTLTMHTQPQGI